MRVSFAVLMLLFLVEGCSAKMPPPDAGEPRSIGPQFWKYDLSDYRAVDDDVQKGLGGRWISIRYARKDGVHTTRKEIAFRVAEALKKNGWSEAPLTDEWPAKVWEQSTDDLSFKRKAQVGEPDHWFFNQRIHISDDAATISIYATVGW